MNTMKDSTNNNDFIIQTRVNTMKKIINTLKHSIYNNDFKTNTGGNKMSRFHKLYIITLQVLLLSGLFAAKDYVNPTESTRNGCAEGQSEDCAGNCFPDSVFDAFQGDGSCDGSDAPYGLNLACNEWNYDDGDCDDCDGVVEGDTDPIPYWYDIDGDG
ncbi:uncharacterized protein METZ01_LOCUS153297, partial [marine metagenome]